MPKIKLCEGCGWAVCSQGHDGQAEAVTVKLSANQEIDRARFLGAVQIFSWNDGTVAVVGATQEELDTAVVSFDPIAREIVAKKARWDAERRRRLVQSDAGMLRSLEALRVKPTDLGEVGLFESRMAHRRALRALELPVDGSEPAWPLPPGLAGL